MKRTDRISVSVWVLDCWVCWSTAWAASPVRWIGQARWGIRRRRSPGGCSATVAHGLGTGRRRRDVEGDHGLSGPPVGRHPLVLDGGHPGDAGHGVLGPVDGGVIGRGQAAPRRWRPPGRRLRRRRRTGTAPPAVAACTLGWSPAGTASCCSSRRSRWTGRPDHQGDGADDPGHDDHPAEADGEASQGGEEEAVVQQGVHAYVRRAARQGDRGPYLPAHLTSSGGVGTPRRACSGVRPVRWWRAAGAAWARPSPASACGSPGPVGGAGRWRPGRRHPDGSRRRRRRSCPAGAPGPCRSGRW